MKLTINVYWILAIILVLTALYYVGGISPRKERDRANLSLYEANTAIKKYEAEIGDVKRYVSEKDLLIIENDKLIKDLKEENERLRELNIRNVSVIGSLKSEVNVLNKKLQVVSKDTDTIYISDVIEDDCIPVPIELVHKDEFSWANVSLSMENAEINFGLTQLDFNLVIGEKGGLLKKNVDVVSVDTPNPYINVQDVKFVVVKEKAKWYQKKFVWLIGGGILGGLLL